MITTFEGGFADAERAAATAEKAGKSISSAAKQMQRAAVEGDVTKLRRAAERLASVAEAARQDVLNAKTAWPFTEDEEKAYLASGYGQELVSAASSFGLKVHIRDEQLVAFPSIITIRPVDLAVQVDRKKVSAIRPFYLAAMLVANQTKKPRFASDKFIETLHNAYTMLVGKDARSAVITLAQVYQALTLLPGAIAEYDRAAFARDLFLLDRSGITRTRSGALLSLPASTGTKGGGTNVFTFVSPEGETVLYYGLQFTGA